MLRTRPPSAGVGDEDPPPQDPCLHHRTLHHRTLHHRDEDPPSQDPCLHHRTLHHRDEDPPPQDPCPHPQVRELPQQNKLLQFVDVTLEAKYAIYINKLCEPQDLYWTLAFVIMAAGIALTGAKSVTYRIGDWLPFFAVRGIGHFLSLFCPQFWLRYREMLWVCERWMTYWGLSLPLTPTIRFPDNHRFAYGCCLLASSSLVGKVRFHVQLVLTIAIQLATYVLMWTNASEGLLSPSPYFILAQHLSSLSPCVWVYYMDRGTRKEFLEKFHMRQLDWMTALMQ